MSQIVIVGGGPIGLAAALLAARADQQVIVVEKQSEGGGQTDVCMASVLGERGLKVLDKAGITHIPQQYKFKGTVNLSKTNVQIEDHQGQEYLIEKNVLSQLLKEYIIQHFSQKIEIYHDTDLQLIDLQKKTVKCLRNGVNIEFKYEILIGADKIDNKVRDFLQESGIISTRVKYVSHEKNTIFGPFSLSDFQTPHLENHFQGQEGRQLLFVRGNSNTNNENNQINNHSIIVFNQNQQYYIQITYPQQKQHEIEQNVDKNQLFRNYLREYYEDLIPGNWIENIEKEKQLNEGQINSLLSCNYKKNKINNGNVILLGDSALTSSGIFNEDLNFGLEDCEIFYQILQQVNQKQFNNDQFSQKFVEIRKPEIDAFESIELCGLILMTRVNELKNAEKYKFLAIILPNIIFLQLLNIFLPSCSKFAFLARMKNSNVKFSNLFLEMIIIAIIGWIFMIVFLILLLQLAVQFLLVYFIRIGAAERFESMLRLVNEAFHFV